jgi:hypothetical protein
MQLSFVFEKNKTKLFDQGDSYIWQAFIIIASTYTFSRAHLACLMEREREGWGGGRERMMMTMTAMKAMEQQQTINQSSQAHPLTGKVHTDHHS